VSRYTLTDFPKWDESVIDKQLEERMYLAQTASSIVLSLRRKVNIKVRQPLAKMMIPVADEEQKGERAGGGAADLKRGEREGDAVRGLRERRCW